MKANVVLLANKWWEAVALVSVLEHARGMKPEFSACPSAFETISRRAPQESAPEARLVCRIEDVIVKVFCIEDMIPADGNSSSSMEKQLVLKSLTRRGDLDDGLIIAFGTAASPETNCAGNVVLGSSVFVFDASEHSHLTQSATFARGTGEIVECEVGASILNDAGIGPFAGEAQKRFLPPPNNPSPLPTIFAGAEYVSVGVANVLHNKDYKEIDLVALQRFGSVKTDKHQVRSIETTHGLIRLCVDNPFIYVSGIANQVGRFENEVAPNKYSQNFAASHNAAITVAWMLPAICKQLLAHLV